MLSIMVINYTYVSACEDGMWVRGWGAGDWLHRRRFVFENPLKITCFSAEYAYAMASLTLLPTLFVWVG